MREVRYGIVGCGAIFGNHADGIHNVDGARLEAVYDIVPERAKSAAEKCGVKAARNLGELLAAVDAVCVCVPSGLHAKVGKRAAEAGKHVLTEKPIEVGLAAAQSLVSTCAARGVRLGVISQHRFAPDIRRLRDTALGGGLGKLIEGDAYIKWYRTQAYYDSGDWRGTWKLDGGGCLMNQGVHYVDMIQWVMGGVRAVRAVTSTSAHERIEVEDVATALVEYRSGAVGVIQGSTSCYPGFAERLEVHGACGSVIIEGDCAKVWEVDPDAPADPSPYGGGVKRQPAPNRHTVGSSRGEGASSPAIWGEQHRLQIEDFTTAILDGRDPYITGEMALEPLKVILAIYRSARRGGALVSV